MWKNWTLAGVLVAGLSLGCDEAQYENAVDDLQETQVDLQQEYGAAASDGVIGAEDMEEIEDQQEDVAAAAGEVAEQKGDLIESKLD